jgi:hypothetical protein
MRSCGCERGRLDNQGNRLQNNACPNILGSPVRVLGFTY